MVNESTNVVDNICIWDGNTNTWTPPANTLMLVQATTPALIWAINDDKINWILTEEIGVGDIGFTWDGTVVTTNEPQPQPPKPKNDQPTTSGTVTI